MISSGKYPSDRRKVYLSVDITNPTWIALGANSILRVEKPDASRNRLTYGTALFDKLPVISNITQIF
jgi:hypothetical protein